MSTNSLAVFRDSLGPDLAALAEEHVKHDLQPSDRDLLNTAARTVSLHATVGSALGLSLGLLLAFRLRATRRRIHSTLSHRTSPATRAQAIRFADGHEEALPDLSAALKPSRVGDFFTITLLGAGGLFFGGETGLFTGTLSARSAIAKDRDASHRIQTAFRRWQADVLRKQAQKLEDFSVEEGKEKDYGI